MNSNLKSYKQKKATPGFIKGLLGNDIIYELVGQYIDYDKNMSMCIHDDAKKSEFDPVATLADTVYVEGAEIIEISEDYDSQCLIYKSDDNIVCFVIKKQWSIAFWNN